MADELIPKDHYLYGREGHDEGRLARARLGLAEEDAENTEEEAWDALEAPEEAEGEETGADPPHGPIVGDEPPSRAVVIATTDEALATWARWHREEGARPLRWLPKGFDRPPTPVGQPIAFQVAQLVEGTRWFLPVERILRETYGLVEARDAVPARPRFMRRFLRALDSRLPEEFWPPRVVARIEVERRPLTGEVESQEAIDAKWREMYPDTWKRR